MWFSPCKDSASHGQNKMKKFFIFYVMAQPIFDRRSKLTHSPDMTNSRCHFLFGKKRHFLMMGFQSLGIEAVFLMS